MANMSMSQITVFEDPNLQRIAELIALAAKHAVENIVASYAQATEYPPTQDVKSIERMLASRFNALPQTIKEAAAARAADLNIPTENMS